MIDLFPIPSGLNISRAAWIATAPVMRDEIIRMWQELSAGEAIQKDRRCGRTKSHRRPKADGVSFYELHLLDMAIWRRPDDTALQEKAAALRERLAPDVERMAQNDDLDEYHAMAQRKGTTLAAALGRFVNMENLLKEDLVEGIKAIARNIGIDPVKLARVIMSNYEEYGSATGPRLSTEQIADAVA